MLARYQCGCMCICVHNSLGRSCNENTKPRMYPHETLSSSSSPDIKGCYMDVYITFWLRRNLNEIENTKPCNVSTWVICLLCDHQGVLPSKEPLCTNLQRIQQHWCVLCSSASGWYFYPYSCPVNTTKLMLAIYGPVANGWYFYPKNDPVITLQNWCFLCMVQY